MDHTREVPAGATEMRRTVCKETLQSLVAYQYEEEAGSQQTRQLIRYEGSNGSYKRGAYRGNRNKKNSLQGNIAELGNNVYQYGNRKTNPKNR